MLKRIWIFLAVLILLQGFIGGKAVSADDHFNRRGRRDFSRHHHFFSTQLYFYRPIYFYPTGAYYYYYDLYPDKMNYYPAEREIIPANPNYLPITSIANMCSQGVPEDVVIEEIRRTNSAYKLNSEIITYLKQNGASDKVIDFMLGTSNRKY